MRRDNGAFFEFIKSGLWERRCRLTVIKDVDFTEVYRVAQEQSVLGLVLAGLEHSEVKPSQGDLLQWIGEVQLLEQRNKAMNGFVFKLQELLKANGIEMVLMKGQGIAQCYERPLWRACGDVDLLLDMTNFGKAEKYLRSMASFVSKENPYTKHIAMTIKSWEVEIHGTLRSDLSRRIDGCLDEVAKDVFSGHSRKWDNNGADVNLMSPDNDVVYVFTHILQHFFRGGIGLRQICDWCRLLWTYRSHYDLNLLESRLRSIRLMSEWKAFGALAVEYLGMPAEAMPLYSQSEKWTHKASRILDIILETGNFGHNKDKSYYEKYPYVIYKSISLWRNTKESLRHAMIFPMDSIRVWGRMINKGISAVVNVK